MIGIYKITNPKGRVYVGQAYNIQRRFFDYKRLACKGQRRLFESLNKYGVDKHIFEVIIECTKGDLNRLEIYYIDLFSCLSRAGLNCKGGGSHIKFSDCTLKKMSDSAKKRGAIFPKGTALHNEATRERMRVSHTGKKLTDDHIQKIRNAITGKPKTVKKAMKRQGKMVINLQTGTFYFTVTEAAELNNLRKGDLVRQLKGNKVNKTQLTYY